MSISVKCPNGHVLKVKSSFAGKSGLCPHCRSTIFVPMPVDAAGKKISDDDILDVLGPPSEVKYEPPPPPPPEPSMTSVHDGVAKEGSGISLLGASSVRKQVACTRCGGLTSPAFTHCPRCGTPLPREVAEKPRKK